MLNTYRLADSSSVPPVPWSYWVVENQLLAGAFPGALDPTVQYDKLKSLLDAGIRTFTNLMEADEVDHQRRPFASYAATVAQLSGADAVDCARYPIPDLQVPQPQLMTAILDQIDRSLADKRPVYVHCWGGVGRTGTVIGCWLLRHGLAHTDDVISTLARLHRHDVERGHRPSPETKAQVEFVLQWPQL